MKISLPAARALLLAAQGLQETPPAPATKQDVLAAIRRMGLLQIDTISVVARSPYLVLWSRLGDYDTRWLDESLAEGALFEYWSHAACFLPIEDYGLYRRRMLEYADGDAYLNAPDEKHREAVHHVLARVREHGPVRSADFERADGKTGVWWDWKPEKRALEHLFNAGVLMIARRESFQRVYDLQERVLPGWDDADTPTREEVCRALTLKAVRSLGVATAEWVRGYFTHHLSLSRNGMRVSVESLAREGQIIPVEVEGVNACAYIHADNRALAEQTMAGDLPAERTTLLSPFDPVVSDRARARTLFGFVYRIETYTPAPKRRYGYFTLPILHRGRLVGRLDPKAHRRDGIFEIKALHLEPDISITEDLVAGLADCLRACAAWHRTPMVAVRASDPPEMAVLLQDALA